MKIPESGLHLRENNTVSNSIARRSIKRLSRSEDVLQIEQWSEPQLICPGDVALHILMKCFGVNLPSSSPNHEQMRNCEWDLATFRFAREHVLLLEKGKGIKKLLLRTLTYKIEVSG